MLQLNEILNKKEWEEFLLQSDFVLTPFFQSWDWGDVQKSIGNHVFRLGVYDKETLVGICLCVDINAKRGHYLHLRHGPVLGNFNKYLEDFLGEIIIFAKSLPVDFIRMSPLLSEELFDSSLFKKMGLRNAPIHNMDAENAWVLDLEKSEDQLLSSMRKTTRYLVKKAQSLPITIKSGSAQKDFDEFMDLYTTTSKRHGFVPHRGLEKEFEIFGKEHLAKLYLAEYEGNIIAGALIIFYGNQAVYHHGASAYKYKHIPATYLIQWQSIQDAKKMGKKYYNFWGVVPENRPKHPWQGLSLFKMGFGGARMNFIHAQDLPLNLNYWKTFLIETAWRIKRGY